MTRLRRLGAAIAWVGFLTGALAMVHALPAVTPSLRGDEWARGNGDAALVAVALLRTAALALGWYLLAATVIATGLRLAGRHRLAAWIEAVTPRLLRRVVHVTTGVTLLAAPAPALGLHRPATIPPAPTTPSDGIGTGARAPATLTTAARDEDVIRMRPSAATTPTTPTTPTTQRADPQRPSPADDDILMRRLVVAPAAGGPPAPGAAAAAGPVATTSATWTIAPGQHLWSIAAHLVGEHLGREASDREVDPYWRRLVAANGHRLAVPDTPDLVYPGQVLEVPPVVTASG